MSYYAKAIKDSIAPSGDRLTTLEVRFPRYVLAEINTHRLWSRSSASSRAIPVGKRIDAVEESPFVPPFGKNQPGMQADEELDDWSSRAAESVWLSARSDAVRHARVLSGLEVHKQVANRLLEPFAWHTAIITSTYWENALDQRDPERSPLGDPALQPAARAIAEALENSEPTRIGPGDFHLPYIEDEDIDAAFEVVERTDDGAVHRVRRIRDLLAKVSTARCARVSFLTHDGQRSITVDLGLFEKLTSARPMHASPLEHVATPCMCQTYLALPVEAWNDQHSLADARGRCSTRVLQPDHRGNFAGWDQYRHLVERSLGLESLR